jgi:signal transduction histidine kinase
MEIESQTIESIEKKIWQLMLLSIVVILFLTLALLALQFFDFIGESNIVIFSKIANKYFVSLAILILLFCAHMIFQQRKLADLSRAFFKEKEIARRLTRDIKTLSALLEVSSIINSQQKLSDILNTIVREILYCFDADHSSIMLLDRRSKMLKTEVTFGKGSEIIKDAIIPIGESIAGRVLKSGKPLLLNGEVDPAEFPGTPEKDRRITSALCVLLKIGGKNIGVMNVNLVDRDRSFSKTDLELMNIFANNIAVGIYNASLYQQIRSFTVQLEKKVLELKNARDELEKQNEVLRENVRLREDIEQITRHDLKAPLNGIINFPNIVMSKGNLSERQREYLQETIQLGYKMLNMINLSLDLYQMEQGIYRFSPVPVDIVPVITDIFQENRKFILSKKLVVEIMLNDRLLSEGDNFTVPGEKLLFYSMLNNLIKNAFEASPKKEKITVSLNNESEFTITIHNQGVVPEDIRDSFFEKYVTSGKEKGTGLGTYSARFMAETQGGSIHLDTSEENGTTVAVMLPKLQI